MCERENLGLFSFRDNSYIAPGALTESNIVGGKLSLTIHSKGYKYPNNFIQRKNIYRLHLRNS